MTASDPTADHAELRALAQRYAVAMDSGDEATLLGLFAPMGALVVTAPGRERPLAVFRGDEPSGVPRIARLLAETYVATAHHVTTHTVELNGDRASGSTYCIAHHVGRASDGSEIVEALAVRYLDAYVRTADGWRFDTREAVRLWADSSAPSPGPLMIDRAAGRRRERD